MNPWAATHYFPRQHQTIICHCFTFSAWNAMAKK